MAYCSEIGDGVRGDIGSVHRYRSIIQNAQETNKIEKGLQKSFLVAFKLFIYSNIFGVLSE